MLVLVLFHFCEDLHVDSRLLEVLTAHCLHIIEFRLARLSRSLDLVAQIVDVSFKVFTSLLDLLSLPFKVILFVANLHDFS